MLTLIYTEQFLRAYRDLEKELRSEVKEKLELFRHRSNHKRLRLHKLHGDMRAYHAFSVNYAVRVVVRFTKNKAVVMVTDIGDHDVYQ